VAKPDLAANWGTLIPRFLLGLVFLYHGGDLLFGLFGGKGIGPVEELVRTWGWPAPGAVARAAAATEFFGGACVALGLLTRFWAAALATVMFVGIWKVRFANGFSYVNGGWEYNFVLGILALSLVVQGGGAFSLDTMFFQGRKKPKEPPKPD
jgi:putative oxidoreductase